MEIKEPSFDAVDFEIVETYIDEDGKTQERKRTVSFPSTEAKHTIEKSDDSSSTEV